MKPQPSIRPAQDQNVLAVWREQVTQAGQDHGLQQRLLQREIELLPRFAAYYTKLQQLPRRVRRDLQRRVRPAHRALIKGMRPTRMQSLAGAALLLALGQAPALAATIPVTTNTPDINADGQCSLIEAIVNANANAATHADCPAGSGAADTIDLPANSTHTLTSVNNGTLGSNGLPVINSPITIRGNNSTITRGGGAPEFRIFLANSTSFGSPSSRGDLTLQDTIVSGGKTPAGATGNTGIGGGVLVYGQLGSLTLNGSTISGNTATGYDGGGVSCTGGAVTITDSTISGNSTAGGGGGISNSCTLVVTDSTVSGNTAGNGGGILNYGGPASLTNTTVSGNTANQGSFSGSAANQGGGIDNRATLTVTNSTISGNSAGRRGGGVHNRYRATANLRRSLVSGNTSPRGPEISNAECSFSGCFYGTFNANNFNLFGHDGNAGFYGAGPGATDVVPAQALAAILDTTLASNAPGNTRTHALVTASPAIDAAGSGCPPPNTDQRGVARPQGAACDIGAFELAGAPPPDSVDLSVTKTDSPDPVTGGDDLTYTLTVANNGPDDATGVTLSDDLPDSVLFASASAGCTELSGVVTCNIGSLTNGSNAIRQIVVSTTTDGTITNTASVTGTEADPDTGNNTANEDTVVNVAAVPMADLAVTKADSPDPVTVGSNLSYTITTTNNGPDPATGVTLTDTLPASVTLVSASPGCAQSGNVVSCTIGNLANGANAPIQITVTPNSQGTLSNTAQVSASENDPDSANNTVTETTTVNAVSGVSCNGQSATIVGTNQNNQLTGTAGADVIHGLGDSDRITGLGGNDIICGGSGNDTVNAGPGTDQVFGEAGNDRLDGLGGNDQLSGDAGADRLFGSGGNDALDGGADADQCNGGPGTDTAANCETVSNVP